MERWWRWPGAAGPGPLWAARPAWRSAGILSVMGAWRPFAANQAPGVVMRPQSPFIYRTNGAGPRQTLGPAIQRGNGQSIRSQRLAPRRAGHHVHHDGVPSVMPLSACT